ncbi:MAG: SEL1-like repeat protein [Alphaproteobacteria bacterium]|nr:SEL1-like repeat protein [Alphaproteobacteria bacterium]
MFNLLDVIYHAGKVVSQNYVKANAYCLKAMKEGVPMAFCNLGINYYYGLGVEKDEGKARKLFEQAEAKGCREGGMFNLLGYIYYEGKVVSQNYVKANAYCLKAMKEGVPIAFRNLGMSYYHGQGVEKDEGKARELFEQAEEKGVKDGWMFNLLGVIYLEGKVVRQDYEKANAYYQKAIEEGYTASFRNLGISYYYGHGVEKDYGKAREWFTKAARQGDVQGQAYLDFMYKEDGSVKQDLPQALELIEKAAYKADDTGQHYLGLVHLTGEGVEANIELISKASALKILGQARIAAFDLFRPLVIKLLIKNQDINKTKVEEIEKYTQKFLKSMKKKEKGEKNSSEKRGLITLDDRDIEKVQHLAQAYKALVKDDIIKDIIEKDSYRNIVKLIDNMNDVLGKLSSNRDINQNLLHFYNLTVELKKAVHCPYLEQTLEQPEVKQANICSNCQTTTWRFKKVLGYRMIECDFCGKEEYVTNPSFG